MLQQGENDSLQNLLFNMMKNGHFQCSSFIIFKRMCYLESFIFEE